MSRVFIRPTALLDGTQEAAKLTPPESDAESYVAEDRVYKKIPHFLGFLSILAEPGFPRLGGYVKSLITTNGRKVLVVQGEDVQDSEAVPVYGFGLSPDGVQEFIGVGRYTGEIGQHEQLLSWVDLSDETNPVFRTPDLFGVIDDPAKVSELTQLIAIGEDATEWALD